MNSWASLSVSIGLVCVWSEP